MRWTTTAAGTPVTDTTVALPTTARVQLPLGGGSPPGPIRPGLTADRPRTLQAEGLGGEGIHAPVKALVRLSGSEVGSKP